MKLYAMLAADLDGGISKLGKIPWRLPEDVKFYKHTCRQLKDPNNPSAQNILVMGKLTWIDMPTRPMPETINLVLTSRTDEPFVDSDKAHYICKSMDDAVEKISKMESRGNIFIFGGSRVYEESFERDDFHLLFHTRVHGHFQCDNVVHFDWDQFELVTNPDQIPGCTDQLRDWLGDGNLIRTDEKSGLQYTFQCYTKKKSANDLKFG
ncbi:hypothetical protein ACOME3_001429 [Neoechinorhynchus agilis]